MKGAKTMLKKIETDKTKLKKLNLLDYGRRVPTYLLDPNFKFHFSTYNVRKDSICKRMKTYTIEEAMPYFKDYSIICIIYDEAENYANIILEAKE